MRRGTLLNTCAIATCMAIIAPVAPRMNASSETAIQIIGSYSQLRQTDEHVYGYELQLFRDGSSLVGLWSRADGEPADFPLVRVEDLKWNETTGAFHFTARWCAEVETFDGRLTPKLLTGTVTAGPKSGGAVKKLSMRRGRDDWPSKNRSDWAALVEKMLKRRAPRC